MQNIKIINSILDTDWYKITMAQVVFFFYPEVKVRYKFYDRNNTIYPDGFALKVLDEIRNMKELSLSESEEDWLRKQNSIYPAFVDWFKNYRFNPFEIDIIQDLKGHLLIDIEGKWLDTIFWEVPLLAIISELYNKEKGNKIKNIMKFRKNIENKSHLLNFPFADFGTRRRFSNFAQSILLDELIFQDNEFLLGTSNPYFAMNYEINPIGTYAHEAIMAMEALWGYKNANLEWIKRWKKIYGKQYNIALSDTFTTDLFLQTTGKYWFNLIDGIRQDSGDPIEIGNKIIKKWKELGINPKTKSIVFSDNLNPEKANKIWNKFKDITNPIFGIGTNLTNDCGYKPLNIVIKLDSIYIQDGLNKWKSTIKLSDDKGKYTGDSKRIDKVKKEIEVYLREEF